jgi:hypothetical protein
MTNKFYFACASWKNRKKCEKNQKICEKAIDKLLILMYTKGA